MLLRLFNDESELVDNSKDFKRVKTEPVISNIREGDDVKEDKTNGEHKPTLKEIVKQEPGVQLAVGAGDAGEPGEKELEGKEPNGANMADDESNGPIATSIHSDIRPGDTITGVLDDYEDEKAATALKGEDQQRRDDIRGTLPEQRDEDTSFNKTV
jgi:hypothetical protein